MKTIERTEYLQWLERWKDKQIIKVVSGVRRCGKSTLFEIYKNKLLKSGVKKEQIISINFEDFAFENLQIKAKVNGFDENAIRNVKIKNVKVTL